MDNWMHEMNIERLRSALSRETDERRTEIIHQLLQEEQLKLSDAMRSDGASERTSAGR